MGGCFSDVKGGQQAVGTGAGPAGSAPLAESEASAAVENFLYYRGLGGLSTPLELSLSASKLLDMDYYSKSDPMAIVYIKKRDGALEEIGRTEVILNSLDPVWITKVLITYQFEIVQPLVLRVYDVDSKYHNIQVKALKLHEQDFLGEASCTLSEIVTRNNRSITLDLQNPNYPKVAKRLGTITILAEETVVSRSVVEVIFRCSDLVNKDFFSKSDPFLKISKIVETGHNIPICKTEVINNNLHPVWKPIHLTMQQFGSKDQPLIIECYDFNSDGKHALIGSLQKSIMELEKLSSGRIGASFYSSSAKSQDHKKMLKSQLFVDKICEKTQFTFLDYISSGFQLNFMVAIDFTASNGNPRQSNSLHYMDPSGCLNAYQQTILEVGDVIQFYDSDKRFPLWGFGGKPFGGSVSHCFNLDGSNPEGEVVGIEGIMAAYAMALQTVSLSGPTLFGPVINKAAQIARECLSCNQNKYIVLLIITDGVITDIEETKESIVKASDLPISILIVGVGGADFKAMEILDADNGKRLESASGRVATRDIVQFVPMRDVHVGQISVIQSLLEELPGQFLTYMQSRDIKPQYVQDAQIRA